MGELEYYIILYIFHFFFCSQYQKDHPVYYINSSGSLLSPLFPHIWFINWILQSVSIFSTCNYIHYLSILSPPFKIIHLHQLVILKMVPYYNCPFFWMQNCWEQLELVSEYPSKGDLYIYICWDLVFCLSDINNIWRYVEVSEHFCNWLCVLFLNVVTKRHHQYHYFTCFLSPLCYIRIDFYVATLCVHQGFYFFFF